ncbi:hypothetical protein CEXT_701871 [Caerostris extrusa]|uniref:Uncharacterized protein n=1 Tax=Caerostris extrusa TaxID=172846 RepID=A0AAV4VLW2_CAEEX|nr:hypothetical protein CEXT_701871 [Caerostris extrusa]
MERRVGKEFPLPTERGGRVESDSNCPGRKCSTDRIAAAHQYAGKPLRPQSGKRKGSSGTSENLSGITANLLKNESTGEEKVEELYLL